MNKLNVFCFGFGQVAENFIKKLKTEKIPFQLTTTSREETKSKNFEDINYQSFHFDEEKFDNNLIKHLEEADHILISIAPVNGDDIVIKNFKETNSLIAKKILENFDIELKKFKQVCPIEMLDKLDNPISLKSKIKKAS